MKSSKTGILLANLGTPDTPSPKAISRYLKEFLSDPRVVDLPRWKWLPLLNGIILPIRSRRIAKNYGAIWTEQGSPLFAITQKQKALLTEFFQQRQQNVIIEIGMTYGNPSMQYAIDNLIEQKVDKIIVLPLYPQYSSTTTAPVFDVFAQALKRHRHIVPFEFIHSYHLDENYIEALVKSIKVRLKNDEFLLFSFHGIPKRYEQEGDFYRPQCEQTAQAVVQKLGLKKEQWRLCFQSRFGSEPWLQPYTDKFLETAAQQGITKLAVICPGFSADCLETLEEIKEENKRIFLAHGGESYHYIPALNDSPEHIACLGNLLLKRMTI
ncbi:ferrochelatase [Basfia succiniciproducens]|uniref:Ferrochelatase n=1 Tax=Basfia succiniciproducens TaxID=653940 RepID=A0A1G5AJJ4_9PAST|nr:ferrochelatase [Basfia succiniciproducens]QIM68668.1 ferrochelatase [Basfia succiniciproducens]SCX78022.1 ferrochelatase [Basfia succiniciproducens]